MRDRTPTEVLDNGALRYGVYDGNGTFLRHEYLHLEDAPTDPGTDLSKATFLKDATETALFGSAADRTEDDALANIAQRLKMINNRVASVALTLKDDSGLAVKDVLVSGMVGENGESVYTDASGAASGYVDAGTATLSVSGYADLLDISESFQAAAGGSYTRTMTLTRRTFLKIVSSASYMFSGNVQTVDVTVGGAGGGGTPASFNVGSEWARGGNGGGMGSLTESTGIVPQTRTLYLAVIGASAYNSNGGASSFLGVTANGGTRGGGGTGAYYNSSESSASAPTDGAAGTQQMYTSMTESELYGGAGGGGGGEWDFKYKRSGGTGGSPGGGAGGPIPNASGAPAAAGTDGTGGGGGGGEFYVYTLGSDDSDYYSYPGAKGGSGAIACRIHVA